MIDRIVQSVNGVTLLGGGEVSPACVTESLTIAPFLAAADGGADRALALGHQPQAVIGDFDSLSPAALAAIPPERQFRIEEQETTDFEKCLGLIRAPFILGLGFTGPRLDHALAVWNALVRRPQVHCLILGQRDLAFAAPPRLALPLAPGTRLSLFPMAPVRAEGSGLRWPVGGIGFAPDGRIGTSNEATGPVSLAFSGPGMLVILPRDCLGLAVAALTQGPR